MTVIHWLSQAPSNVAYDVVGTLVVALAGWFLRRTLSGWQAKRAGLASTPTPVLLPRAPAKFVNRSRDLARLDSLANEAASATGPVVVVLSGLHGVGKTAVTSLWAHANHTRFPDGTLWADFSRRSNPEARSVSDVLGDFLRELGVSDLALPVTLGDRQRMYARLTSNRKLLVLLDDVTHAAQAVAALPTGAGSLVIVTSNSKLEELVRDGAHSVALDPLGAAEALELLGRFVDPRRVAEDTEGVQGIVSACAGLPIALCVCGGKLAVNEHRSPTWLAQQLSGEEDRLEVLSPEGAFDLRAVFDVAYAELSAEAALVYRRIGLIPGRDFTVEAIAAVAGLKLGEAEVITSGMEAQFLLSRFTDDRLRAHDLVHRHMQLRAEADEDADAVTYAIRRVVDWYVAAAQAADHAIVDDRLRLDPRTVVAAPNLALLGSSAGAFAWFEAERHSLLAAQQVAMEQGWLDHVWLLAEAFWPLCASHKLFDVWVVSHLAAIRAGQELSDLRVLARMRSQLARAYAEMGRHDEARAEMQAALLDVEATDDGALRASVIEFNGVCQLRAGDLREALASFELAGEAFAAVSRPRGVALAHYHVGWCLVRLGEPDAAIPVLGTALEEMQALGDQISSSRVLLRLGEAYISVELIDQADLALGRALSVATEAGVDYEQAQAHEALAALAEKGFDSGSAQEHWQAAYRIYQSLGHPRADQIISKMSGPPPQRDATRPRPRRWLSETRRCFEHGAHPNQGDDLRYRAGTRRMEGHQEQVQADPCSWLRSGVSTSPPCNRPW